MLLTTLSYPLATALALVACEAAVLYTLYKSRRCKPGWARTAACTMAVAVNVSLPLLFSRDCVIIITALSFQFSWLASFKVRSGGLGWTSCLRRHLRSSYCGVHQQRPPPPPQIIAWALDRGPLAQGGYTAAQFCALLLTPLTPAQSEPRRAGPR